MKTPAFAIIGHPNEGKSSVLSTLAEDDSVRISPIPGETTQSQAFPVLIDKREVIRFIDTPGFQNPRKTLEWMQNYQGPENELLPTFLDVHRDIDAFRDDCELLTPIAEGAGIIFVVDGSRPVRNVDRIEMEILRLTGAPRMAVINNKEEEPSFIGDWQTAFRKHFNAIRIFNSCKATYAQRLELLESLKSIDQQLEPVLREVVSAFQHDWQARTERSADLILALLKEAIPYKETAIFKVGQDENELRQKLFRAYTRHLKAQEQKTQDAIRALFKHNIYSIQLPEQSILQEDLFSEKTWEFLGLSDKQLILAGALGGAALGVGLDVAAGGASLGLFSAIGGLIGAAGTSLKGKKIIDGFSVLGFKVGGEQLRVGPINNSQLLFILIDRSLLFYSYVINWAHGRRDYEQHLALIQQDAKEGFTTHWDSEQRRICLMLFKALQKAEEEDITIASHQLREILITQLQQIATT
ncbi:MAG: GTPase/DUF3482 domain-containing protein [Desulfuromonadaceae bacterium]|nr:GTPase/DUF3482 domain-containing protein [Desulfuromonadaceae bacterium]